VSRALASLYRLMLKDGPFRRMWFGERSIVAAEKPRDLATSPGVRQIQ